MKFILVSKFLVPKGFRGITLFPFIFLREETDATNPIIINHEKIHLKQQLETGIIFFYVWYGLEFLYHRCTSENGKVAYMKISFEREAYSLENDLKYLETRKFWAFLSFI